MLRHVLTAGLLVPALTVISTSGPATAATERTCHGRSATIVGTPGDDRLVGTRGRDVIVGLGGNDTLRGLQGDDVLCGGDGADHLLGGIGDDRLYGGLDQRERRGRWTVLTGDVLEGGPGDDHLTVGVDPGEGRLAVQRRDTIRYRHSARAVEVDLRAGVAEGEGSDVLARGRAIQVDGSRHDDVLLGSHRSDILEGGRGSDRLSGRGGSDLVLDDRGDDVLDGGGGADAIVSNAGRDTLVGGAGHDDMLSGSREPATLLGGPGPDYLARTITAGDTGEIDGGPGGNQLELYPAVWFGEEPSATLDASAGTAVLTSGSQTQTTSFTNVRSFTLWYDWSFRGTEGDDFVQVLAGQLHAEALGGDDFLIGDEADDVLDGGDGTDAGWGGRGRNTCIDTETGNCSGYPFRSARVSARVAPHTATPHGATPPHRIVSRWLSDRALTPEQALTRP